MSEYSIYERIRTQKGYTNADVSKGTGIGQSTFSDWKKGRSEPKMEKLTKIANFLDVSVAFLMYGETDYIITPPAPREETELVEDMKSRVAKYDLDVAIVEKFMTLPVDKKEFILKLIETWGVK